MNINNRKILNISAGAVSAFMLMTCTPMQVYAVEQSYNQVIQNGNNVIEQNGVKLTVTNIQAVKNKIKISMELQDDNAEVNHLEHNNLDIRVKMNDMKQDRGGSSYSDKGNGKLKIEEEIQNDEGYPESGILRIDALDGKLGLNGTLKIPVDFTEDFKDVFKKEINSDIDVNGKKANVEKFESNRLVTCIAVSNVSENTGMFHHMRDNDDLKFIVNVDGRIYYSEYPDYTEYKDGRTYNNFTVEELDYEKVKNAGEITIVPVINSMTSEEIDNYYKNDLDASDEVVDNENIVKYPKSIKFSDGSKGDINIVRKDNKIKIYCSSDSEFKSMMMAVNSYCCYTDNEEYFNELGERSIYKDKDNQYVVEYDDTEKNMNVNMDFNYTIGNIDKYSLGEEIKIK